MTRHTCQYYAYALALLSSAAYAADSPTWLNHIEISASLGQSWLRSGNTPIVIGSHETDTANITSVANNVAWKIGVGYSLFADRLQQRTFFNKLLIELNLYQINGSLTGNVWINQNPAYDSAYTFRAPTTSTRLMLDVKPTLFTWQQISAYPIVGIGIARNTLAYYETPTDPDNSSYLSLGAHTTTQFASEIGAGISTQLCTHLNATLEYLYASLGHATASGTSSTFINPQSPPTFELHDQSLTAGLNWQFG